MIGLWNGSAKASGKHLKSRMDPVQIQHLGEICHSSSAIQQSRQRWQGILALTRERIQPRRSQVMAGDPGTQQGKNPAQEIPGHGHRVCRRHGCPRKEHTDSAALEEPRRGS